MRTTISRHEAIKLISRAREVAGDQAAIQELLTEYRAPSIFDALLEVYAGVNNGFLSAVCEAIYGLRVEVIGTQTALLPCPCCHRRTMHELFNTEQGTGYEICEHCGWEDDGTSDEQESSSVNGGPMTEYRERVAKERNYYDQEKWPY